MRALPRAFETWLTVSEHEEVLALLDLVQRALEGRGFVVALAVRKIPRATEEPAQATRQGSAT